MNSRLARVSLASLSLVLGSCVTVPKGEVEDLKPAVRALMQSFRWKDFRGAADLMVPERQEPFIKERKKLKDDNDLFITNFELEDAKLSGDMLIAKAVTRISWYRLPSSTEKTATVTNVFVWKGGVWLLESMDDGPFEDLLPEKEKAKKLLELDGGTLPD